MALTPGFRLGPYEILAPIGAGGMGEVWKARDTRLKREVAIKVMPSELSANRERLKRFENEARSASSLNHPNIVTIHDIGQDEAISWIAMEYVDGTSLRERLSSGALPIKQVLGIGAQIADGLARAHASGIVHRDLKPENVMITREGLAKILDFGLAKLTQQEGDQSGPSEASTLSVGTEPGVVMGTVGYMSPEQACGKALDFRSDQFSLGSVLYEMATGKRAFKGGSKPEVLAAIIRDEPEPTGTSNPRTPIPLRWIIERCLAKDPRERYASTEDLARDLVTVRDRLSEAAVSGASLAVEARRTRLLRLSALALIALLAAVSGSFLVGRRAAERPFPSFQRLTFRRGEVPAARFSSDGQTVVYSFSGAGGPADIYAMRVGSPEFRALGLPGAQLLGVSPQGEMAVAMGWKWGGPDQGSGTLARVSSAGGAPRQLLEDAIDADWAPDGKNLAVLRWIGSEGARRIEFPLGKALYETKFLPFVMRLRVSPQGDLVALLERDRPNGVYSIHVVDRAGKSHRISDGWSMVRGFAWAKGGKEVWFAATKSGVAARALYAVTLSGGQRLVTRFPADVTLHDVSPGGRVLLTQENIRRELAGRLSGDAKDRDLTWLDYSFPDDLSEDGKRLLLGETGEGSGESPSLWLRTADQPIPMRLGEGMAGSSLSPDGKWVAALRTVSKGPNELNLMPTGPGDTRPVPLQGINPVETEWLPDGMRLLVYGIGPGGNIRPYVVRLPGGAPRPIVPEDIRAGAVTPDGKWILGIREDQVALYPIDGGEARPLHQKPGERLNASDVLRWGDDNNTIITAEYGVPARLYRLDIQTWQKKLWKEIVPPDTAGVRNIDWVRITSDGASYVCTFRRVLSELYLVDGLK